MVVLAEMGDKTQLLAMAFASRYRWQTVIWSVFVATLANHFLAVIAGNTLVSIIPLAWLKTLAAVSFIFFGLWTIHGDSMDRLEERTKSTPFWTVAMAFFIAEMGDKTQLMTMAIAADEAIKIGGVGFVAKASQILPVWMGSTTGMVIADGFGIVAAIVLKRHIPEKTIKWVAALIFIGFGLFGIDEGLDHLFKTTWHHPALIVSVPVLLIAMWTISRAKPFVAVAERDNRADSRALSESSEELGVGDHSMGKNPASRLLKDGIVQGVSELK
jgi:putative Ca2+/H+ antiporter (TMEM165/GDT1 family)